MTNEKGSESRSSSDFEEWYSKVYGKESNFRKTDLQDCWTAAQKALLSKLPSEDKMREFLHTTEFLFDTQSGIGESRGKILLDLIMKKLAAQEPEKAGDGE